MKNTIENKYKVTYKSKETGDTQSMEIRQAEMRITIGSLCKKNSEVELIKVELI